MGKVLARLKNYRAFVDPYPAVYFPTEDNNRMFEENFEKEVLQQMGDNGGQLALIEF